MKKFFSIFLLCLCGCGKTKVEDFGKVEYFSYTAWASGRTDVTIRTDNGHVYVDYFLEVPKGKRLVRKVTDYGITSKVELIFED